MAGSDWQKFDWIMVGAFLILCVLGGVEIYYSTRIGGVSPYLVKHLIKLLVGVVIFLIFLFVDYRVILTHILILYALLLGLLLYVLFFGVEIHSSKSWLQLGLFSFQPSEIAKIVIILTLAKFFADFSEKYLKPAGLLTGGLIVFLPVLLIVLQHDLGTALTLMPVLFVMLMMAGIRRGVVVVSALVIALALAGSWFVLQDYQKERIRVVLDPERDPKGTGYQTLQSVIAIGSGGLAGRGLGNGSQGALGFLPERHTDFIFAVAGEELGFVGASLILFLYIVIFYRGLKIAFETRDKAAMYVCVGLVTLYGVHLAVNVGMTLGLAPVIGIPLPPLSYGGSSLAASFMAVALMNNFQVHRYFV